MQLLGKVLGWLIAATMLVSALALLLSAWQWLQSVAAL